MNKTISECLDDLRKTEEYTSYLKLVDEKKLYKSKLKRKIEKLDDAEKKIEAAATLEHLGREAEIIALEETLRSINEHAKKYLDRMFDDTPMHITLRNVNEKKQAQKFQMHTHVEYKGQVYDDIDELSGGEKQLCHLAFLLGINDMLRSPVLMLDECLNNLDPSIDTDVVTYLRECCGTKLILVISHQAVQGMFDAEIHI
jgi:DNA repair exonuclease SbcCD ATPase subunit